MAALALSASGRVAGSALRQALAAVDPWLRAMAADIAGDLGRESIGLLPEIERALDDEDASRKRAIGRGPRRGRVRRRAHGVERER